MILSYTLISSLILCGGYLYYRLILADARQHAYNRALLYIIYLVALLLPLILMHKTAVTTSPDDAIVQIGELTSGAVGDNLHPISSTTSILPVIAKIMVITYLIGIGVTMLISVIGIIKLMKIIDKGEKIPCGNYMIVLTASDRIAPFSWIRFIIMTPKDLRDSGDMIIEHERCHLRLYHWVDLMIAQAVICLQWFNPAAWLMRDELRSIHEYQADEAVIMSGVSITEYQKMLIRKAVGSRFQSFANSLNHSKLKKRVTMMYKEKSSSGRRISALLLAPALAAGCLVTAIPSVASVLDSIAEVTFVNKSESKVSKISESVKVAEPGSTSFEDEPITESSEPIIASKEISVEESSVESTPAEKVSDEVLAAAEKEREILKEVDKIAEFPGGWPAMMEYLRANIKYPEEALKNNEEGMVVVKFVVEADGSVSTVDVVRSQSQSLDAEAMRVVKEMPKWNPAQKGEDKVAAWFSLPVNFKLPADPESKTE